MKRLPVPEKTDGSLSMQLGGGLAPDAPADDPTAVLPAPTISTVRFSACPAHEKAKGV
jgi:hypothetical protein